MLLEFRVCASKSAEKILVLSLWWGPLVQSGGGRSSSQAMCPPTWGLHISWDSVEQVGPSYTNEKASRACFHLPAFAVTQDLDPQARSQPVCQFQIDVKRFRIAEQRETM